MMETFSQNVYVQPVIFPVSGLGSTIQPAGAYIDVTDFEGFGFLLAVGANDRAAATIQILQATAAAGTGSKNITGAVNTTINTTSKWLIVETTTDKLDLNNGFRYVAIQPTFTGGTVDVGVIIFMAWRSRRLAVTQPASCFGNVVI